MLVLLVLVPYTGPARGDPTLSPCSYAGSDGIAEHADCVEQYGKGLLRIRSPHLGRLTFDENSMASVFNGEHGWMYVNKKGEVVVAGVSAIDNGPETFQDGFVRFERNRKCGYAVLKGPGTIAPQFDGCENFKNGIARVCTGCRSEPVGPGSEYHEMRGGTWFCIDRKGKKVACAP